MSFFLWLTLGVVTVIIVAAAIFDPFQQWYSRDRNARPAIEMFEAINDPFRPTFQVGVTPEDIPDLDQLRRALPLHLSAYGFFYTNEWDHIYQFRAIQIGGGAYDVLILQHPSYGFRSTDNHSTHRYNIGTSYEKICFAAGVEPYDLPDACWKAVLWATATSHYIAYGTKF